MAHPTGTMLAVDGTVLWSYVCPVGDPDHRGCIMRWDEDAGVRPWLVASMPASDWMMAPAPDGRVYLVERHYDAARQTHRARVLVARVGEEPDELLPWFDDVHRFGEGGFAAMGDGRFLFARYPTLYVLEPDGAASVWTEWPSAVYGVRQLQDGTLLIRGEAEVWRTTADGSVLDHWSNLLEGMHAPPPFMGNRVFDADYAAGTLWMAYWGKRRFDAIAGGTRTVVTSFEAPWLPHAVAVAGSSVFMLASTIAPGEDAAIRPSLWRQTPEALELVWGERGTERAMDLGLPDTFALTGSFASPAARQVRFTLRVAERQAVRVVVLDDQGRVATVLVDEDIEANEERVFEWDARAAPRGTYVIAIEGARLGNARHMVRIG